MNYKIVTNTQRLLEFIDWLPDLEPQETFYVSLLARNKYLIDKNLLKGDKCSLKRFTSNKKYLFRKIKQLECEVGAYEQDGIPIPQEALALYIGLNPVNQEKAAKQLLKQLADLVTAPYIGYNLHQLALSQLQMSDSRKIYADIDFDGVTIAEVLPQIKVNHDCLTFLQTHGGFHLLMKFDQMDKKYEKSWYKNITGIKGADITKSTLIPMPGTFQGGFEPRLISI